MSPQRARPVYDRWRDAEGTHIPVGCRVEQVDVNRAQGALRCRLGKRGVVVARSPSNRLRVRFDGEERWVSIRPHLVRMLAVEADRSPRSVKHVIADLRDLLSAPAPGRRTADDR